MNEDELKELMKEKEIKRLTSPPIYPTGINKFGGKVKDIEGNPVEARFSLKSGYKNRKYIIEPKKGILSDDEILIYASESKAASEIRLKRGTGDLSDKKVLHGYMHEMIWLCTFLILIVLGPYALILKNNALISILIIILLVATTYHIYFLHIKDYTNNKYKTQNFENKKNKKNNNLKHQNNTIQSFNIYKTQVEDLKSLYEVKEKIAKELIEKRFTPPQITYDRFISAVDSCTDLFNNQVEVIYDIINLATEHTSKIDYEIETRINILKSIIEKIDSLTNELVINIGQSQSEEDENVKNILEDMENLIGSIKDYN